MDCNLVEEKFNPFILGALESAEMEKLQAHVDSCVDCNRRIEDEGEMIARLAFAVPRLEAPPHLKDRLLARIEIVDGPVVRYGNPSKRTFLRKGLYSLPMAGAVASILLLGTIFGGVWLRDGRNDASDGHPEIAGGTEQVIKGSADLSDEIPNPADFGSDVANIVGEQGRHAYEATNTSAASVNMLWGTGWRANARGMLMVSRSGSQALLLALDLRPLPADKVYQVWLIKDGRRYDGGHFTVDSSGYGQTLIFPYSSIAEFERIGITIEPIGGSSGPTGKSVLKGDL